MDFSEPPFEALLLFKQLSFGLFTTINSFFTWVAVLTAAVSLWKIRAINNGSNSSPRVAVLNKLDGSRNMQDLTPTAQQEQEENPTTVSPQAPFSISCDSSVNINSAIVGHDGSVKGRFTVYYRDDGEGELMDEEDWHDEEVDGVWRFGEWKLWDVVVAKRTRDLGWYRYQDLTVLNGNVVRLWDSVRSRCPTPLCECGMNDRW